MALYTYGQARADAALKSAASGGYDPLSLFMAVNSVSGDSVRTEVASRNSNIEYRSALQNYQASQQNASADYREALASYNSKKSLLASDISYASYLQEQLAPTYSLKINQAQNLLIKAQEQRELIDSLPDPLDTLNLKRESHDATVSYTEELLANLENQFGIQKQLLDRKYTKDEGRAQVQYNASGFGGIGMVQAIGRDIQAQKRLEVNLAETNKETEAIQKRYNITAANIELKGAELQYKVDAAERASQILRADETVLDKQFNLDSLEAEYENAKVEAAKRITDLGIQQKYLTAPTKRQLGAAPIECWVAPGGGGVSAGGGGINKPSGPAENAFKEQTLGAF